MNGESLYRVEAAECWPEVRRYYAINHAFYEMDFHTHPEMEIMYAADGGCTVFTAGPNGGCKKYPLREREYIFLDSGIPHRLSVERGAPCRVLNLEIALGPARDGFSFGMLQSSAQFRSLCKSGLPVFTGYDLFGELHQVVVSLQKTLYAGENSLECRFRTGLLFLELAKQFGHGKRAVGELVYVKRAAAFLQENFDRKITVPEVAAAAGASKAYLQRLFKAETGCSIVDRILEMRVEKAKYLLETSTLLVIDIAVGLGFNSRQHFSQTFRRLVGCPPALYRKRKGNLRLWEGFNSQA